MNTRELVLDMLLEITGKHAYSHILIREVLDKYNYMDSRDKSFVKRLTEGTLERMLQIDFILNQFSKVPVAKMKPLIRCLLRMSVYQLLFLDNVPDSAVCNEAVKLAGKRGFRNLQGFVNGVLRNIARQKAVLQREAASFYPNRQKQPGEHLSVLYSMPLWIVEKWLPAYGYEVTERMLQGLMEIHAVTVRIRQEASESERDNWLAALQEQKVRVQIHPYLSYAFLLSDVEGIQSLPGFMEGFFMVQDVSSMLVTECAGIKAGDLILDVCAAPGGKALHAADKLFMERDTQDRHKEADGEQQGRILARDLTENKIALIQNNIDRMQMPNITAQVWDACKPDETLIGKADVVFADVPCSGLGILGKKRDIKYNVTPESLSAVNQLQRSILSVVQQYVKPGGILMYSTCTINQEENEQMVAWITEELPFVTESMAERLPPQLKDDEKNRGMLQLLPGIHATDGFFLAKLRRV